MILKNKTKRMSLQNLVWPKFRNLEVKRNFWLKEILLEKSFHNITVYDEIERAPRIFPKNLLSSWGNWTNTPKKDGLLPKFGVRQISPYSNLFKNLL